MKVKRSHVIGTVIVIAIGVAWIKVFLFTDVFRSHGTNEPNRMALLQIRNAVDSGASHADVLNAYWQHRSDQLRLQADGPTSWEIRMPLEFGASDWTLLIEFQEGRVSAVRVRTADGPPPKGGPEDKGIGER